MSTDRQGPSGQILGVAGELVTVQGPLAISLIPAGSTAEPLGNLTAMVGAKPNQAFKTRGSIDLGGSLAGAGQAITRAVARFTPSDAAPPPAAVILTQRVSTSAGAENWSHGLVWDEDLPAQPGPGTWALNVSLEAVGAQVDVVDNNGVLQNTFAALNALT